MYGNSLGLISLAAAIWVIYDVIANQKSFTTERKVLWVVCALFFSIITAIVYYLKFKAKK